MRDEIQSALSQVLREFELSDADALRVLADIDDGPMTHELTRKVWNRYLSILAESGIGHRIEGSVGRYYKMDEANVA